MRVARRGMPKAYRSPLYHMAWLGPVLLVLWVGVFQPSLVKRLQDQTFDFYQRIAPRAFDPALPVRIVDIDDRSLAKIGQWPWPRTRIAELMDRLRSARAAAIAFDIVFSEPDRTSAEAFLAALPDGPRKAAIGTALGGAPSNDAVLAKSIGVAQVVLGFVLTQGAEKSKFVAPYGIAVAGDDPKSFLPQFSGNVLPLSMLARPAAGLGALNWLPDGDQIVRRVPVFLASGDSLVPSLAMESLRVAQGASTFIVRAANASGDSIFGARGLQSVRVGALEVETSAAGDLRPHYTTHRAARFIPAWKILDGSVDPSEIDGRIVLVGSSSAGLTDIRATPVDPAMPGVEIQAQSLETLMTQTQLARPDWSALELCIGVALVLCLIATLPLVPAVASVAVALSGVGTIFAASWWAFQDHQLLIDPIMPSAMLLLAYFGSMSALFRAEQRDRRFVQDAFGRFVSPAVVASLARNPDRLALGGELRPLTVMFSDVRNFAAIAERMSASDLTLFLNRYLSPMSEIVLRHGGTVDKYIGDAIMAFWNAPLPDPDHAEHAARATLEMLAVLPTFQDAYLGSDFPAVRCGIGLATGPCVVGNFGSSLRFDYSALGDDVNLASRLEGLTKVYGVDILATESVRVAAPRLAWLDIDTVVVMGRSAPTQIVALLGDEFTARTDAFGAFCSAHDLMLVDYRCGRFEKAEMAIDALRDLAPAGFTKLYDLYTDRCRAHLLQPTLEWDGVTRIEHK